MKQIKRTILLLGVLLILATMTVFAGTPKNTTEILVNGESATIGFIEDDKSYIPLRVISETLGAKVDWDNKSKTVTVSKGGITIAQKIGSDAATINGNLVNVGTSALIRNNLTYVPVRFISETLDAKVHWDQATRSVNIMVEGLPWELED